jgi:hypothetical protein
MNDRQRQKVEALISIAPFRGGDAIVGKLRWTMAYACLAFSLTGCIFGDRMPPKTVWFRNNSGRNILVEGPGDDHRVFVPSKFTRALFDWKGEEHVRLDIYDPSSHRRIETLEIPDDALLKSKTIDYPESKKINRLRGLLNRTDR